MPITGRTTLTETETRLAAFARRPRRGVFAAVFAIAAIGWFYLALIIVDMIPAMDMSRLGPGMKVFNVFNDFGKLDEVGLALLAAICQPADMAGHFAMPGAAPWGAFDLLLVFLMWVMMALAMMLPTAAPMVAAYGEVAARRRAAGEAAASPFFVAAGYMAVWSAFGAVATLAQWGLTELKALSPEVMAPASLVFASTTLVAAGIYQFTPAKHACLAHCQAPLAFFEARPSDTFRRVFALGIEQGTFCVGCCWALMAVMFAVGLMNILWIAVLAIVMGVEKAIPSFTLTRIIGAVLIAWGTALFLLSEGGRNLLEGLI